MKNKSIMKQIKSLGLDIETKKHEWTLNGQTYLEFRHTVQRGPIYIYWTSRIDGSATTPMVCDATDPSDPSCDYSGKVTHVYKVTRLANIFKFFEATSGDAAVKLVGNLAGMSRIK